MVDDTPIFAHKWAEVVAYQHSGKQMVVKNEGFLSKNLKAKRGQWVVTNRLGEVTVMNDKDFRFWFRSTNPLAAAALGET